MNEIKIFENPQFGAIRTMERDGEPWFVGKDVAETLGYQNGSRDINRHVDEDDRQKIMFFDGNQNKETIIINESGLYSLILSSKLPTAKEFKRWVTSEVLPSIRKSGGYIAGQEDMSDADLMAKALLVAQRQIEQRLFTWMRDNGYLIRRKGADYNMPTQRAMEMQLFEIKESVVAHADGHTSINKTPKVTGKGQIYFINKLRR